MCFLRFILVFLLLSGGFQTLASGGPARLDRDGTQMQPEWRRGEEWTVFVKEYTRFIPFGGPPGQFTIHDLDIGMPVLVEGCSGFNPLTITAQEVFFGHFPPNRHVGHDPMMDAIGGIVTEIDTHLMEFQVLVQPPPGGPMIDLWMTAETAILEAFRSLPLFILNFQELRPGDPVMVMAHDDNGWLVDALVRSDDWIPESQVLWGQHMQVYGFIEEIIYRDDRHGIQLRFTQVPPTSQYLTVLGPEGGRLEFPWGYLDFPCGALDHVQEIAVSGDFIFWWTLQNVFLFEPHGLEFNMPVEFEIRYFNLEGIDPENVNLTYYDEDLGKWRIATHMNHFESEHCFRGEIDHFSRYSLSTNGRPLYYLLGL
ncbi:hypothetical protein JXA40_12085 [bacterium]|nr:hypothetical protein [candidate division CSSED10-310 bacterium]